MAISSSVAASCPASLCIRGKLTEKSDFHSCGVVQLELITGHPPISTTESVMNESLVAWVSSHYMAFESIFQVLDMPLS